ncbi:MAG: DUF3422 family protein [Bosea sp. (in: a-proteobacteria)]
MKIHALRDTVLSEVHARPFAPVETGTRILHLGFVNVPGGDPRGDLANWCETEGFPPPPPGAKHHAAIGASADVSWEQHTEFVTLTLRLRQPVQPFAQIDEVIAKLKSNPPSHGELLVAIDMHLVEAEYAAGAEKLFDVSSLVMSKVQDSAALVITDLKPNADGFVRWLVVDHSLSPRQAGALTQRLLEIETYRTFALLGLPEAQRLSPGLRDIELAMTDISDEMTRSEGLEANNRLLEQLTALASRLEADAARSAYRFGASRAYHEIVRQRLAIIGEEPGGEGSTIAAFLDRRVAPAMRTCQTTQDRQADLSRKLSRTANLLRTRVDVELEQQNRDLLAAMNDRTRLQLRLQQTVEGLSVAAISYYVVGLFGYLAKAAKEAGLVKIDPNTLTGFFVPVAILCVWAAIRRIRKSHKDGH